LATELLSKCGVKENEIFLKELESWGVDGIDDNRASQMRAHGVDFLEKYVIDLADRAGWHCEVVW